MFEPHGVKRRLKTPRAGVLVQVALRDLWHNWRSSGCLVIGTGVAIAPLLLLYGLNFGFVTGLIDQLRSDPRTRELRPVGQYRFNDAWFRDLQARKDVAFLLPRIGYIASSIQVRPVEGRGLLDAELVPTAPADPLLAALTPPGDPTRAILSESLATKAKAKIGDQMEIVLRGADGAKTRLQRHEVVVSGVLERAMLQRDALFVTPGLGLAIERWRQGFPVSELGWEGVEGKDQAPTVETYASFRLYAVDVRDVPALRDHLVGQNINVQTRAENISAVLEIERGLGWVFLIVCGLTSLGFLLTLGLHLAATVITKSPELSILRLLGLTSLEISAIPSIQGAVIAALGAIGAGALMLALQPAINLQLEGLAALKGQVSRLEPEHVGIAILASILAGAIAGSVAGWRAASMEPTEGLRHG